MRYRTMIELICDASDRDDACHTAGEYLRGDIDSGVSMRFKTRSLYMYRIAKYGIVTTAVMMCFAAILLTVMPVKGSVRGTADIRMPGSCTVQPELKTSENGDFRKHWESKKDEAVLDYIKN